MNRLPYRHNKTKLSLVYFSEIRDKETFMEANDFAYVVDTHEFAIRLKRARDTHDGLDGVIFLEGVEKLKELYDTRLNTLAQLLGASNIDNIVMLIESISTLQDEIEKKLPKGIDVVRSLNIDGATFNMSWKMEDGTQKEIQLPINELHKDITFDEATGNLVIKMQDNTEKEVFIGTIVEGMVLSVNNVFPTAEGHLTITIDNIDDLRTILNQLLGAEDDLMDSLDWLEYYPTEEEPEEPNGAQD